MEGPEEMVEMGDPEETHSILRTLHIHSEMRVLLEAPETQVLPETLAVGQTQGRQEARVEVETRVL